MSIETNLMLFKQNELLAPYTTYKIGGPADYFFVAKNKEELIRAIQTAHKESIPFFILGAGANILIGDKGYRGLVIKNECQGVRIDGNRVMAESGVMISDLIELTADSNLSGLEHFAGIPSTVGGAMWQNLHFLSPDRTKTIFIEGIVDSAEILEESGNILKVGKDFFKFDYDYSILHDKKLIILDVVFRLESKDKSEIRNQIIENLKWRNEKQPQLHDYPSCGSVFKKIEGVGAGRLIDQAGLKGLKIGGAMVSEKHANYIVNMGNATALDVVSLINIVQEKVKISTGYDLEKEIKFVGDF